MKRIIIYVIFLLIYRFSFAKEDSCIECHNELEGEFKKPVEMMKSDIHYKFGISCVSCHGGNPTIHDESAMDKKYGFIGIPNKKEILKICSKCHSNPEYMKKFNPTIRVDQLELYKTSKHGILLEKGDEKVAVCSDCHSSHGILPPIDSRSTVFPQKIPETCGKCHKDKEYMKEYGIPINQVEEYLEGVHGEALMKKGDLSAPSCNDCHGNHGSTPPGVENISYVCRECHSSAADLFVKSPHKSAFDKLKISECEACHGNHKIEKPSDEMLEPERGICSSCHEKDSKGFLVSQKIYSDIKNLKDKIMESELILNKVYKMGIEVSDAFVMLEDAKSSLINARNLVHSFEIEKIEEAINEGLKICEKVYNEGKKGEKEAITRRKGYGLSLIFFIILIFALLLKLKLREEKTL
jgi:predicted CXXCH cytochrome family protein